MSQAQRHYTGQALKQLYVLVLGLDVIGNPYGLVVGLKKGVEDLFYEPFQVRMCFTFKVTSVLRFYDEQNLNTFFYVTRALFVPSLLYLYIENKVG